MPLLLLHQSRVVFGEGEAGAGSGQRNGVLGPECDAGVQGERGHQDVQLDILSGQQSRYMHHSEQEGGNSIIDFCWP